MDVVDCQTIICITDSSVFPFFSLFFSVLGFLTNNTKPEEKQKTDVWACTLKKSNVPG